MNTAIRPMPNIPMTINRRMCRAPSATDVGPTIISMIAARTKRMRLVVAGPKLSLGQLVRRQAAAEEHDDRQQRRRALPSVAGCGGRWSTTAVVGSLIATAPPYALRRAGAAAGEPSATVTVGVPGSLVGEIQETAVIRQLPRPQRCPSACRLASARLPSHRDGRRDAAGDRLPSSP